MQNSTSTLEINSKNFIKSLALLGSAKFRQSFYMLVKLVFSNYLFVQYKKSPSLICVETPLDRKIPFVPKAVNAYVSYIPFSFISFFWAKKNFGQNADKIIEEFAVEMKKYFSNCAQIFKSAQTTCRRGQHGRGNFTLGIIRILDRDKNASPSLHVILAVVTLLKIYKVTEKGEWDKERQITFKRTVKIIESILLTKQHCIVDISTAFAILSANSPDFTKEFAANLANSLFNENSHGISAEDIVKIREQIISDYNLLLQSATQENSTEVIINFLRSFPHRKAGLALEK